MGRRVKDAKQNTQIYNRTQSLGTAMDGKQVVHNSLTTNLSKTICFYAIKIQFRVLSTDIIRTRTDDDDQHARNNNATVHNKCYLLSLVPNVIALYLF